MDMEELHRIYEQQIEHWFYCLLSPEKQEKVMKELNDTPEPVVEGIEEANIIWN